MSVFLSFISKGDTSLRLPVCFTGQKNPFQKSVLLEEQIISLELISTEKGCKTKMIDCLPEHVSILLNNTLFDRTNLFEMMEKAEVSQYSVLICFFIPLNTMC